MFRKAVSQSSTPVSKRSAKTDHRYECVRHAVTGLALGVRCGPIFGLTEMTDLTYAIGDIHGCDEHLRVLLEKIEEHRAGRRRKLVFLSDYIDRGRDSAGVSARLRELQ